MKKSYSLKWIVRIFVTAWIFLGILFLQWWAVAVALFISIFYFNRYYEALLLAFFFDLLYGVPEQGLVSFSFTIVSGCVLLIVERVKSKLVFYN